MIPFFKTLFQIWFVGILAFFTVFGYLLYSFVWVIRMVQKTKKKSFIFIPVMMLLLLSAGFGCWYLFFPLPVVHQRVEIIIPKNAKVYQVADSLRRKKVITSRKAFLLYVKLTNTGRKVQAGKAEFRTGNGVMSAVQSMMKATTIEFSVTIPEGLTIEQSASRITRVFPSIDTSEFISLCNNPEFISKLKVDAPSLEGFLFPETYNFAENVSEEFIITRMVQAFDRCYESLTHADVSGKFTKLQLVTIASIVEREATIASEQTRIAAVFHNRIRIGYPLGADPTVRYALKKFNGPLTVSDLNSSSPYNTRKYKGIPPGPICSPGKGALQAALTPMETKDLYFVAKWDGSGEHDFSKTNEEHNRKKLLIRDYNHIQWSFVTFT